jgi:DNA ligase-1
MQAHKYKEGKHHPAGWFVSEKLDGRRAFWDGGISRNVLKQNVPYANNDKDERYLKEQIATGLWSRYGNVIHAPDWWLNQLPNIPLDGELFIGRSKAEQQELMSITASQTPGSGWNTVDYMVFDFVPLEIIFATGVIDIANFHKVLDYNFIQEWCEYQIDLMPAPGLEYIPKSKTPFLSTVILMKRFLESTVCQYHEQTKLPMHHEKAIEHLNNFLQAVEILGGEGVVLRKPESIWRPERNHHALKMKSIHDMEGTVIGYITGRKTDKGSKLLGMMGALVLKLDNEIRLELSGFTDSERELGTIDIKYGTDTEARMWAIEHPETELPDTYCAIHFPRGSRITFQYRDLSRDGVPVEARYFRKREEL